MDFIQISIIHDNARKLAHKKCHKKITIAIGNTIIMTLNAMFSVTTQTEPMYHCKDKLGNKPYFCNKRALDHNKMNGLIAWPQRGVQSVPNQLDQCAPHNRGRSSRADGTTSQRTPWLVGFRAGFLEHCPICLAWAAPIVGGHIGAGPARPGVAGV